MQQVRNKRYYESTTSSRSTAKASANTAYLNSQFGESRKEMMTRKDVLIRMTLRNVSIFHRTSGSFYRSSVASLSIQ
jgi:hypothetical protein